MNLRLGAARTIAAFVVGALFVGQCAAAISTTGNVSPDPNTTTSSTTIYLGKTSNGTMAVDGGSSVTTGSTYIAYSAGVTSSVVLTDANTQWKSSTMYVGFEGTADVKILAGATATSSSVTLGSGENSFGSATVRGTGSFWNTSFIRVGDQGDGQLVIDQGGMVSSTVASLGSFEGYGIATIKDPGSTWALSSSLSVGPYGNAAVKVENGGTLTSASASLGGNSNYVGNLSVTGAQSTWTNAGDATIGSNGTSTVSINDGGVATVGGDVMLGRSLTAVGELHFDNGTLNAGGLITRFANLLGAGTINTHGLVTDVALDFDATHHFQQQFIVADSPNQNVTINLDANGVGSMGAGFRGQGSLTISDGKQLLSRDGILGYQTGSNGAAVVQGADSRWKISRNLSVGTGGTGSLLIQGNAAVEVSGTTTLGSSASDSITFNNGTLTTTSFLGGVNQLHGTGTINAHGLVFDDHLVFDNTQPNQRQFLINALPDQNIVINLDVDGTGILGAGNTGQGSLTIADGKHIVSTAGYLGYQSGSTGTADISGAGTKWSIGGYLNVGQGGTGNLNITDGAKVSATSSSVSKGKVIVSGVGSTLNNSSTLSVGSFYAGPAELQVLAGGTVTSKDSLPSSLSSSGLGVSYGSTGKATIDGAGSSWTHEGVLTIGGGTGGYGSLTISNGGVVTSGGGTVADGFGSSSTATSSVVVSGAGSRWGNSGSLSIGAGRAGSLTVSNGGSVTSTNGYIGNEYQGVGTATITGQGSSWLMSGTLALGYFSSSTSTLNIQSGAIVQAVGDTTFDSGGRLNLQGGTFSTAAVRNIGSGQFNWTSGTLHVGTYYGNLTNGAGVLAPGQSPGKTTISGNYIQQTAGTLQIEIGGLTSITQYATVSVTGTTTLGGTLQLSLLSGFVPTPANTFTVLSSTGNLTGVFGNIANGQRLLTSDGLGTFLVSYGAGSAFNTKQVVLSAFNIAGDFNADGAVDGGDYTFWRETLSASVAKFSGADGDGDGVVDSDDYTVWRSHFGMTASSGSGSSVMSEAAAVPEPTSITLLSVLILLGLLPRESSRHAPRAVAKGLVSAA